MKKSTIWFSFIVPIAGWVFFGNAMIFPDSTALSAPDGANFYVPNCGACHPQGGNKINPTMPLAGSAKMKSSPDFHRL